jgi:hypothetical protein
VAAGRKSSLGVKEVSAARKSSLVVNAAQRVVVLNAAQRVVVLNAAQRVEILNAAESGVADDVLDEE